MPKQKVTIGGTTVIGGSPSYRDPTSKSKAVPPRKQLETQYPHLDIGVVNASLPHEQLAEMDAMIALRWNGIRLLQKDRATIFEDIGLSLGGGPDLPLTGPGRFPGPSQEHRQISAERRYRGFRGCSEEKPKDEVGNNRVKCMSSARFPGKNPEDGSSNIEEKEMKLPGATATWIRIPAFLNSLPRLMLKTKGSLQGFLLSLVSSRGPANGSTSLPSSTTWPMPIPYPEVFSRKASDRVRDSHWKRLISLQVVVLSWLALGCPFMLGRRLSAAQWSVVRMLEHLSSDGTTPEFVEAQDMGRAAGKVEDMEFHLAALAMAVTSVQAYEKSYFAAAFKTCFLGVSSTTIWAFDW